MELNPGHPVTASLRDQWHKIVLLVMEKLGTTEVVITQQDINRALQDQDRAVLVHDRADGLHVRIITMAEAERLAKAQGGCVQ